MASNSIAERIFDFVVATLDALPAVKKVADDIPTEAVLKKVPSTQLPYVAVVSKLPRPKTDGHATTTPNARVQSELPLTLYCYFQAKQDPSRDAIRLTDDIWAGLLADISCGGLAMDVTVIPDSVGYIHPFVAMIIEVKVRYLHNGNSI